MNTVTDPREILQRSGMTGWQILIISLTVCLNAMDGFDVLVIAVSANGIAAEWGMERAALGFVLTAELVGMAFGSLVLGGMADSRGRRFTLLLCLSVMALGMLMTPSSGSPYTLCFWRVFTGLGIGGMLACTNAVAAEFSNTRNRALCISLMVIGYPLGGIVVSVLAEIVLVEGDWRTLFYLGGTISTLLIPAVYLFVPESIHWLCRKGSGNSLVRLNASLRKIGHSPVEALPQIQADTGRASLMDIFSPQLIRITFLVLMAYALHMMTFYFIIKWAPVIVTDFGFNSALASGVLTWANIGAASGGFLFGLLTRKVELKKLTIIILVLSMIGVALFGRSPADLTLIKAFAAFAGFFGNAAISGLYAIIAIAFPTYLRATGTGFVIGLGRGGAIISPVIVGFLLQWQVPISTVGLIMGAGSLVSAFILMNLQLRTDG